MPFAESRIPEINFDRSNDNGAVNEETMGNPIRP
jgi:hypothetical protein|tara:strand:- start:25801 stop:25902 length:102 start_codon:yes stop_codon:yes gene_type:complete